MAATHVQSVKVLNTVDSSSSSTPATTYTAGNALIVSTVGGSLNASGPVVTDTTHTLTFTKIIEKATSGEAVISIFVLANIPGGSTVVQTTKGAVMIVQEWSGLATTTPQDVSVGGGSTSSSTSQASGTTPTTSQATELIFGAHDVDAGISGAPTALTNGFSNIVDSPNDYEYNATQNYWPITLARKDATSVGTFQTTWTWDSGPWTNALATFKLAGGGGGGPTILLTNKIPSNLVRM